MLGWIFRDIICIFILDLNSHKPNHFISENAGHLLDFDMIKLSGLPLADDETGYPSWSFGGSFFCYCYAAACCSADSHKIRMCEMIGASKQSIGLAFICQPKQRAKQIC